MHKILFLLILREVLERVIGPSSWLPLRTQQNNFPGVVPSGRLLDRVEEFILAYATIFVIGLLIVVKITRNVRSVLLEGRSLGVPRASGIFQYHISGGYPFLQIGHCSFEYFQIILNRIDCGILIPELFVLECHDLLPETLHPPE